MMYDDITEPMTGKAPEFLGEPFRDDDAGVEYRPIVVDQMPGYRAEFDNGDVRYVYLNASGGSDDGKATVFVYQGGNYEPWNDAPCCYIFTHEDDEEE